MKIYTIALTLAAALLLLPACNDWLDVKPKTQVEADEMFKTEDGYKDVLTGAYIQMTATPMYGRQLTFGMVDCLGSVYNAAGGSTGVYTAFLGMNYTDKTVVAHIDSTWRQTYTTITNLNIMLDAFETASKSIFEEDNYNCIYGEALGLRAYLHFDMLRLFAPSYLAGADEPGIPYVDRHSFDVTPQSTVKEVCGKIIGDLTDAAELLRKSDPVVTGLEPTKFLTASSRVYHMNYYAVKATMARVYLYMGDTANAKLCAQEVIDSGKYKWTSVDNIATTETGRDRTFSSEQIFALQVSAMYDNINYMLYYGAKYTSNQLTNRASWRNAVYSHAGDWRLTYFWSDDVPGTNYYNNKFNTKLWQPEGMTPAYAERMPLIRLPEMYLIVAECDAAKAPGIFNTIRANRGITAQFNPDATQDEINNEVRLEYLREFVCEGVMFYYYKRLDSSVMAGTSGAFNKSVNKERYVLPMPDEEMQFGGRE